MEEIWGFITNLTDDDLLQELRRFETTSSYPYPLTCKTRRSFEKCLAYQLGSILNEKFCDELNCSTNYIFRQTEKLKSCPNLNTHTKSFESNNPDRLNDIETTTNRECSNRHHNIISGENKFNKHFSHSYFTIHQDSQMGQPSDQNVYFGVSLPAGITLDKDFTGVYENKKEALLVVKKYKGARFKMFQSRLEAEEFSRHTSDKHHEALSLSFECLSPESRAVITNGDKVLTNNSSGDIEKPSPFKSPKPPELIKLRKAIESGDVDFFNRTVWSNPRYLISSGDTPVILQEGSRYNALHVAAKSKQTKMTQVILSALESPKLFQLMYEDDTDEMRQQRMLYIVDLYLNTPDKGLCETALHFASKFGCAEIVDILASHPAVDRQVKNKYKQTPFDVACSRCPHASPNLKKQIEELLEDRFIVPVLRDRDNSVLPIIGDPLSPDMVKKEMVLRKYQNNPIDPDVTIKAFAGPMSPMKARDLHRRWKTPVSCFSLPDRQRLHQVRLSDSEKGLERIGRQLARESGVSWKEYWSFLGCFCDLSEPAGLTKLESHLKMNNLKYSQTSFEFGDFDDEMDPASVDVEDSNYDISEGQSLITSPPKSVIVNYNRVGDTSLSDSILTHRNLFRIIPDPEFGDTISVTKSNRSHCIVSPISQLAEQFSRLQIYSPPGCKLSPSSPQMMQLSDTQNSNSPSSLNKNSHEDLSKSCIEQKLQSISLQSNGIYNKTDFKSSSQLENLVADQHKNDDVMSDFEKSLLVPIPEDSNRKDSSSSMSSNSSDANCYYTPPTGSPVACSLIEENNIFIEGLCPCKIDLDVWRVLESVDINPLLYPHVYYWKKTIANYQDEERQIWPSPASSKFHKSISALNHASQRLVSTPIRALSETSYSRRTNFDISNLDDSVFNYGSERMSSTVTNEQHPIAYNFYDAYPHQNYDEDS